MKIVRMDPSRARRDRWGVHRMGPAPAGAPRLAVAWPRLAGGPSGPGTGDLRFDGRVCLRGTEARLSAWLAADLRARLGALSETTSGAVRVRGGRVFVHVVVAPGRPTIRAADVDALWSACARGLRDPLARLVRRASSDPDPRARALAGRRLLALARGRARSPYDEALLALVVGAAVPDWIRAEAFLGLWRAEPAGRRRWVELALAAKRSALTQVATQAALDSAIELELLVDEAPATLARELERAWRLGSELERARLRERVEDLSPSGWRRLRAAAPEEPAPGAFAAFDEARRGALSAPDLTGGELAVRPEPD